MDIDIIESISVASHSANAFSGKVDIVVDDRILTILGQARQFLEDTIKGEEINKTGKLCAGASGYLKKLGWAMRAFDRMGKKQIWEERISWLKTSSQALSQLKKGDLVKPETIIEIREFFHQLLILLLALEVVPTDVVTIRGKLEHS